MVDKFGNIYEGRKGSIDNLTIGGHASGFNRNTMGVSALGNFEPTHTNPPAEVPTSALVKSIGNVLGWKLSQHGLLPKDTATLVHGSDKSIKQVSVINAHRDLNETACPGKHLHDKLDSIRGIAAETAVFRDTFGKIFSKEIAWLAQEGISTGWDDGTFRPLQSVNRDAMAAFMYRLHGKGHV